MLTFLTSWLPRWLYGAEPPWWTTMDTHWNWETDICSAKPLTSGLIFFKITTKSSFILTNAQANTINFQQSGAIDLFIIKKFKEICFKLQWQLLEKSDMTAVDRARRRVSNGNGPTCSSQPCGGEIFTLEKQIKLICNLASHSCQWSLTEIHMSKPSTRTEGSTEQLLPSSWGWSPWSEETDEQGQQRVFGFQAEKWAKGLGAWIEKRPPQCPWQMATVKTANPADVWRRTRYWEWMP